MENFSRSDLACESGAIGKGSVTLPRDVYREEKIGDCTVARLDIRDEAHEKMFGKPRGTYVTFLCGKIWLMNDEAFSALAEHLSREIRAMCSAVSGKPVDRNFSVLVAGLGNSDITPDAIGPDSVRKLNVTRHLKTVDERLYHTVGRCEISAVFPGVLLVLANLLRLVRQLIKDDFPTLERPAKAISGTKVSGYCAGFTAVARSFASIYSIKTSITSKWILREFCL